MRRLAHALWTTLTLTLSLVGIGTLVAALLGYVTVEPSMLAVVVAVGYAGAASSRRADGRWCPRFRRRSGDG